jgi:methylmalonyl-CoA/ethylmalonyl-CoA epimerase
MITGVRSITIAVNDLNQAVENYQSLLGMEPEYGSGYEVLLAGCGLREVGLDFADQVAVFDANGVLLILITGSNEDSPIGRFLRKKGEGVFMVSFEADDAAKEALRLRIQARQSSLTATWAEPLGPPIFIHPKDMNGVMVELFQPAGIFKR